ncbi:MAG: hypothetical protein GTO12_26110, partial [Proteobacteria bacterium]|nr:hypothetical protein [Pseudomonadota bacterium]
SDEKTTDSEYTRRIEAWIFETLGKKFVAWEKSSEIEIIDAEGEKELEEFRKNLDKEAEETGVGYRIFDKKIKQVRHVVTVGGHLIAYEINPIGYDDRFQPLIPIIDLPCIKTRKAYAMGLVSFLRGPQEEKNKGRSQAIYYASLSAGGNWVEEENAIKDKAEWRKNMAQPGGVGTVSKGALSQSRVQRINPLPLPTNYLMREDRSTTDIERISRVSEVLRGEPP